MLKNERHWFFIGGLENDASDGFMSPPASLVLGKSTFKGFPVDPLVLQGDNL